MLLIERNPSLSRFRKELAKVHHIYYRMRSEFQLSQHLQNYFDEGLWYTSVGVSAARQRTGSATRTVQRIGKARVALRRVSTLNFKRCRRTTALRGALYRGRLAPLGRRYTSPFIVRRRQSADDERGNWQVRDPGRIRDQTPPPKPTP